MNKQMRFLACLAVVALAACAAPAAPAAPMRQTAQPERPALTPEPGISATQVDVDAGGGKSVEKGEINPELVAANTRFGFKLYSELLKADGNTNVFFSPASVAIALAMTYNGAKGDTQQAMANTLELQGMSLEQVNQAYASLLRELESADPDVEVAIANSLWARAGVDFYPDFLQRTQLYYDAEVATLDFNDPGAVDTINGWVSDQTQGKIPAIVDQVSPDAILYLINAVYFNGGWVKPFDEKLTQEQPFNLLGGGQKPVPMMRQSGEFAYLKGPNFQAVKLPYGKQDGPQRYGMAVVLPDEGTTLAEFEASLSADNWNKWSAAFAPASGDLAMPRFTADYDTEINKALEALGMAIAFDPVQADFSGMRPIPPNVFISSAKHKAYVDVNEQGTEAAAVTSIEMGVTSAREEPERFSMVVDRPFFTAIYDTQTGEILFMGQIVEP